MNMAHLNQILARIVLAAAVIFMIGSVTALALTGATRLLILTAFGATAGAYAAAHLSRYHHDEAKTKDGALVSQAA